MSTFNLRRIDASSCEAPTFTSLGIALISEIISHLNPTSLQQFRLVNKFMKSSIDAGVTRFHYGNHLGDTDAVQLEADFAHAYRLWPGIKEIKFSFSTYDNDWTLPDVHTTAPRALTSTTWTDVEIVNFRNCKLGPSGGAALGLACAQHWRKLRTLKLGGSTENACDKFFVEFLKGEYPLLEEIYLRDRVGFALRESVPTTAPLALLAARCPKLRVLKLYNNDFGVGGFLELAKGYFLTLEVLDLYPSQVRNPAAGAALATLISHCPKLKELLVDLDQFLGASSNAILDCELPNLEVIDISGNCLGDTLAPTLAAAKWPRLRKLAIFPTSSEEGFESICQGNWPLLEEFEASLEIDVEGALALRTAACGLTPRWPRLRSLKFDFRNTEALHVLLEGDWKMLTHLNLEYISFGIYNNFGIEGANILAAASTRLTALKSLNIADTMHSKSEIQAFLSGNWSNLEQLVFGGEEVSRTAWHAMATGLQKSQFPALRRLEVSGFYIENFLQKAFVKFLVPHLEEIRFLNCCFDSKVITSLAKAAKGMINLRCLILEDHKNEDDGLDSEEILEILLSARWPKLERVLLQPFPVARLPEGARARGWRVTDVDEQDCTVLEKIGLETS